MIYESDFRELRNRIQANKEGKYNCIPLPFPRFRHVLPGWEKGIYVIITALEKVGKSKLVDYMFIYYTIFLMVDHPELKVKILYFTLEDTIQTKRFGFYLYLLWKLDRIHLNTSELRSLEEGNPLDERVVDLLESERYQKYLRMFDEMVTFKDDERNPTGINKFCKKYALDNGHYIHREKEFTENGETVMKNIRDGFEWDDPETYQVIILDNMANMELEQGLTPMQNIVRMSKYFIELRKMDFLCVAVQHQAAALDSNESFKMGRTDASSANLGDAKTSARDIDLLIGLNSPFKIGKPEEKGYDVKHFKDYLRFMNVIADRKYGSGGSVCPLYFDGAVTEFKELPASDDKQALEKVYRRIHEVNSYENGMFIADAVEKIHSLFLLMSYKINSVYKAKFNLFDYLRRCLTNFNNNYGVTNKKKRG